MFELCTTSEFVEWFETLEDNVQKEIDVKLRLLKELGPQLHRPYSDTVQSSSIANMKELRIQEKGRPYRVFYCFGENRKALLLIGGVKDGSNDKDFYRKMIPIAEQLVKNNDWK
jgi:hypothetical protein